MARAKKWLLLFLFVMIACVAALIKRKTLPNSDQSKTFAAKPPVAFVPDSENKGLPCRAVYYGQGDGDGVYDPHCFDIQAKLSLAANVGDVEQMTALLRAGANADSSAGDSYPPLYSAARSGQNDAVQLLLDNGADINQRYTLNGTPLFATIYGNHPKTASLLITRGADVNVMLGAETALQIAQHDKKQEFVDMLKKAGAKP